MGRFDVKIDSDFEQMLGDLEDVDEYAPIMLTEAAPILTDSVKKTLDTVVSHDPETTTGTMIESIQQTKARHNRDGSFFIHVHPTGTARKGGGYLRKGMTSEDRRRLILRSTEGKTKGQYRGSKKKEGGVRDDLTNMEKAVYLEYGTKRGQPPRPWAEKAVRGVEGKVMDKMQEVFNREVEKNGH